MLKIAQQEAVSEGEVFLRLDGKVVGQWVEELRRSCDEILRDPGSRLVLELMDVTFVDADGIGLLRELSERQVVLRNCSPFVVEQLRPSDEMPSES